MNQQLIVIIKELKQTAIRIRESRLSILGHNNLPFYQCHNILKTKLCLVQNRKDNVYISCANCPMSAGLHGYSNSLLKVRWV